jgi:energy-converting hydrogenase Eha subunit A
MNKLFCFIVFILMVSEVNSQVNIGVRASMNVARFKFSNQQMVSDYKPVIFAGVFGNYRISKKMSTQVDALGFVETTRTRNLKTGHSSSTKTFLLRVPAVIQYRVATRIRIATGPQVGLPLKSYGKPLDWRWTMVAAYQVPFVKGVSVSSKYSFSMDNLQMATVRSGVLQFGISYSVVKRIGKA